jgi:hypothetical protein
MVSRRSGGQQGCVVYMNALPVDWWDRELDTVVMVAGAGYSRWCVRATHSTYAADVTYSGVPRGWWQGRQITVGVGATCGI